MRGSFEKIKLIKLEEFYEYYNMISPIYEDDKMFISIVKNVWSQEPIFIPKY